MMESSASGGAQANLSVTGQEGPVRAQVGPSSVDDVDEQWSVVINIHDSNLAQVEGAIASNLHQFDPHPSQPGRYVRRHPMYIVAVDYSQIDEEGHPAAGKPLELDLQTIRDIFSARYPDMVAPGDTPEDGSHIRLRDYFTIAEKDSVGNPTGRVTFGNQEDAS
jgi:hypothetical protein